MVLREQNPSGALASEGLTALPSEPHVCGQLESSFTAPLGASQIEEVIISDEATEDSGQLMTIVRSPVVTVRCVGKRIACLHSI